MTDNVRTLKAPSRNVLRDDSSTNQFGDAIEIPYGLTIVGLDKQELLRIVSNTLTHLARCGSTRLDIGIPRASRVVSICTGERHTRHVAQLAAANKTPEDAAPHEIKDLGLSNPVRWASPEGGLIFKSLIAACKGWVMLEQTTASGLNSASGIKSLLLIREMAKNADLRIMLFVVIPKGDDTNELDQCCDEYINIKASEPDFGCDSAFSIDVASLRNLNAVGVGKTLCNVKFINGMFRRRYTPFISEQLENRVIWALRAQEETLDIIAKIMKINKSTVLRRLQTMPPVRRLKAYDELLSHYLDAPPIIGDVSNVVRGNVLGGTRDGNDA